MTLSKTISHILSPDGPNNLPFLCRLWLDHYQKHHQPGHQTEEGMEGDEGDGDADQDPNCSTGSTPIRDMVDIPEITKRVSWLSITTDTDGSKW